METELPNLSMIIDLTATKRYYNPKNLPRKIRYVKIFTQGRVVPDIAVVER